jgi:CheY-like chemotaxis protein
MKILVIEDHDGDLKFVDPALSIAGSHFVAIQEDRPQLILLDPARGRLPLARKLKADPGTRDIHSVAITCNPEQYPKAAAPGRPLEADQYS